MYFWLLKDKDGIYLMFILIMYTNRRSLIIPIDELKEYVTIKKNNYLLYLLTIYLLFLIDAAELYVRICSFCITSNFIYTITTWIIIITL